MNAALLRDEVCQMSDAELRDAAATIRGTAKRGARRKMTEAETLALSAILCEQEERRRKWAYGCGEDTLNG